MPSFSSLKRMWWVDYEWSVKKYHAPKRLRHVDPVNNEDDFYKTEGAKLAAFLPSYKWIATSKLPSVDAGYITPLYNMKAIALRYGLTQNSMNYFKKHIMPDPFDIVRRRSTLSHHWSYFTILALDVAMRDLERHSVLQFLRTRRHHIEMVRVGTFYMEDYYGEKYEQKLYDDHDKYGVKWLEGAPNQLAFVDRIG